MLESITIKNILATIKKNKVLAKKPPYQRHIGIWDDKMRIDLIKSILIGNPAGIIAIAIVNSISYLNDGQQRTDTVMLYAADGFSVNGRLFSQLSAAQQSAFMAYEFPFITTEYADLLDARIAYISLQGGKPPSKGEKIIGLISNGTRDTIAEVAAWSLVGDCVKTSRMADTEFASSLLMMIDHGGPTSSGKLEDWASAMDKDPSKVKGLKSKLNKARKEFDDIVPSKDLLFKTKRNHVYNILSAIVWLQDREHLTLADEEGANKAIQRFDQKIRKGSLEQAVLSYTKTASNGTGSENSRENQAMILYGILQPFYA